MNLVKLRCDVLNDTIQECCIITNPGIMGGQWGKINKLKEIKIINREKGEIIVLKAICFHT